MGYESVQSVEGGAWRMERRGGFTFLSPRKCFPKSCLFIVAALFQKALKVAS